MTYYSVYCKMDNIAFTTRRYVEAESEQEAIEKAYTICKENTGMTPVDHEVTDLDMRARYG